MSGKRPGKKPVNRKQADPEAVAQKRERRAKASALRAEEKRKTQRRAMLKQIGIVGGVAIVAVAVVVAIMIGRTPDYVAAPPGFDEDGDITVGATQAPVTVTVVEDFSCPHCASTDALNRRLFDSYEAGEDVRIDYRPIAFLNEYSTTEYATRALNAAVCTVGEDPESWNGIQRSLMDEQPSQGSSGLSDDRLVELAVQAGAERASVTQCIKDRTHEDWIKHTTHRVTNESDFAGTPAIMVNDKLVNSPTPEKIDAAVQEALGQ